MTVQITYTGDKEGIIALIEERRTEVQEARKRASLVREKLRLGGEVAGLEWTLRVLNRWEPTS